MYCPTLCILFTLPFFCYRKLHTLCLVVFLTFLFLSLYSTPFTLPFFYSITLHSSPCHFFYSPTFQTFHLGISFTVLHSTRLNLLFLLLSYAPHFSPCHFFNCTALCTFHPMISPFSYTAQCTQSLPHTTHLHTSSLLFLL
jgi:hypothetical protein